MATSNVNINITVDTAFSGVFETSLSDGLRPNIVQESPHLTRCIIAFFQNGTEISSMRKIYTSEEGYESNGLTATLSLDTGTTYTIVVYMDNNKDYIDVTNLKAITLDTNGYCLDGNPQIFSSDKIDVTPTADVSIDVTLLKRYGRISFIDTNPTSRVVNKKYFFNSYCPTAYNAYTGKIVDAIAGVHFDNIDKINVLATQTKQTLSFALYSYDASGNIVKAINNASVESQANYLTKVYYSSALRKSIDLTTLPGWSALSDGSHNITIVAKADGYKDSEPSEGVTVTKEAEEEPYITFTGESSDFTLSVGGAKEWDGTVEYSTDHNTWTVWDGTAISSVDKKLYLRGSGNTKFYTSKGAQLSLSAKAVCSGNIQTLLEYGNPPTTLSVLSCYRKMFYGCTNLTQAPTLPATTLSNYCYQDMFNGCTNLTQAPTLPATTATYSCYSSMFNGCTNLTQAPALPATTLANNCYQYMFRSCTSLTTAPALPATTLANNCYYDMFHGCTSLTTAPALPATTLAGVCYYNMFYGCSSFKVSETQTGTYQYAWRIPTSGTVASAPTGWNSSMLSNTGGTFTSDPSINTTYYVENEPV